MWQGPPPGMVHAAAVQLILLCQPLGCQVLTMRAVCRSAQETGYAEVAGPLPGDGFMGESPAPRRGALMHTPMQDKQQHHRSEVSRVL